MSIVSTILGLVSWVVGIIVLIKLFQKEGVVKGILGIICMLYTFIWGWMHASELGIKNTMLIWTGVILLSVIVSVIAGAVSANQSGASLLPFFA